MFVWGGVTESCGVFYSRVNLFSVNMISGVWHAHIADDKVKPTPCYGACSAVVGNTIYSYGGVTSESSYRTLDELYKLNIEEMRWRRVEIEGTKPAERWGAAMCCVNGKLIMMGGYGPMTSDKRRSQAEYKEDRSMRGYGCNNELWSFDGETGEMRY